jgi:hypothetical protein
MTDLLGLGLGLVGLRLQLARRRRSLTVVAGERPSTTG